MPMCPPLSSRAACAASFGDYFRRDLRPNRHMHRPNRLDTRLTTLLGAALALTAGGTATRAQATPGMRPPANETMDARARRYESWASTNRDPSARLSRVVLWECATCPEMVIVPSGDFTIGSPTDEPGRGTDEGPQRRMSIERPFAVSRFEITRGEYKVFLRETGHAVRGNCVTDRAKPGTWAPEPNTTLFDPGFEQADDHPVVCVSWDDAKAYVAWLNRRTSGGYRLLTGSEWEFAARAGSTATYPWGPNVSDGCPHANTADSTIGRKYPTWTVAACDDGALHTSPVGAYHPNALGLYDMIGNAQEWVEDCATDSYDSLPPAGHADLTGDCARRVVRSSSWGTQPKDNRVANRVRYPRGQVDDSVGIRVAKTLADAAIR